MKTMMCLISARPGGAADDAPMTEAKIARTMNEATMCVRRGTVPSLCLLPERSPISAWFPSIRAPVRGRFTYRWAARYGASVMPWGFRRSLRLAGPLRLNLSKSGLGLSLGVPGLHIGVGPRGRYVRAGLPGTGVYYRKSLNRPRPAHVHQPTAAERESPWMAAVHALLDAP